ncbi:hypothetical protein DBV05_g9017 [Lasiodiplodia theobromae]|uniref:Uncharacterized protein n=2 Tax=Lasiodiplodia theobromae TaxID=45133 RepID=A0A5N5D3L7_9PEZI|nr:hypothetical protein DBV05_g9017 [Lasiodiplodia theobromae]
MCLDNAGVLALHQIELDLTLASHQQTPPIRQVLGRPQPSASAAQGPTSSGEGSSTVVAKAPTKVKTEVVEEEDRSPLSPTETGVIPRPASPDGMDIDVPAEAQPQVSRIGSSAAEAQQANAPENISHVKETLPHGHLNPQHVETQDNPQAALGIPDNTQAPGGPVPSPAKEKAAPVTDPQRNAATDAPVNPPGDVDTIQPPPNADDAERSTGMPTGPPREISGMTEPSSTFDQFSQIYPEYTGNRKHFENLCGQLEWLRRQDRGLHPFLWDDYIIRSRTDYRKYTEECGDEGIDPLPWHKYYVESIPMPKFIKGVMNPAMLEKFFVEQGRSLRPIIHSNISRMEHVPERSLPPTFSPPVNSAPGGKDNQRPKKPKRQNKRKNGNLQQGVVGSPLRHNANQMPAPWTTTTPLPAAGPSSASNHAQTAATSTTAAEPFPQKPPQPAPPAPATRPPPKPPAPTAHQLTVRGAQNNPRPPPTSASAARSALAASSARAASAKPPPAPPPARSATSGPQQTAAAAGAGSAAKGLPTITNPNKRKRDGDGSPPPPPARPASSSSTMTTKATKEKRPNGMPAPPPPSGGGGGGSGGGAKGNKPRKTMFTIYKERRKAENSKKSTPGGSRAGSVV